MPDDLDPTAPVDPIDPEAVIEETRRTFSLSDRLGGIKHRAEKVVLFTDLNAVDAYNQLNTQAQSLVDAAGKVDLEQPGAQGRHDALVAEHNRVEEKLEEAKVVMLQSALTIQLQAYPNILIKVVRRDARKKFVDPATGDVPEERMSEFREYIDLRLLSAAIATIIDAEGHILDLGPRDEVGQMLSDQLPPSQWQRLYDTFIKVTLTDQIALATANDPGF